MKLKVSDLGPIKEGEIELGGLTVLCGDNNTGKSHLAYTVYGYFSHFSEINPVKRLNHNSHHLVTSEFAQKLFKSGASAIEVDVEKLAEESSHYFKVHFGEYEEKLHAIFAAQKEILDRALICISPNSTATLIARRLKKIADINLLKGVKAEYSNGKLKFVVNIQERLDFYSEHVEVARMYLAGYLDRYLLRPPTHRPFIVTSERSGILLFYKELDSSRNALVDALQNMDKKKFKNNKRPIDTENYSRYAKPISAEINYVRDLEYLSQRTGFAHVRSRQDLYDKMEKIIGGRVVIHGPSIRFQSRKDAPEQFDIPLHMASSSTRKLANLYFYIKHVAVKDDLLIIEEPESHLSHHAQRILANLLCRCVTHGIKVLITTHSEIMLKEISNMIIVGHCNEKCNVLEGKSQFYSEVNGLKKHNVKAYECIDSKVRNVEVTRQGMEFKSIDKVSAALEKDSRHLLKLLRNP